MDRASFAKLLSACFYPMLRAEGFRGSGVTLRRISGPATHVFNVQGSAGGNRCYLNLGCHFAFLPTEGGQMVDLADIVESQCAFRSRVEPPANQPFGWHYGNSEEEARGNINLLAEEWTRQAQPFFALHSYPDGLARLVEQAPIAEAHPKHLLTLARVALHLRQGGRATAIAQAALERANPAASGLKHDIRGMLERVNAI